MEKILLVINAHKPNLASISFACKTAEETGSKITGLFIENLFYRPAAQLDEASYFSSISESEAATEVVTDTEQAVQLFVQECALQKVQTETYMDKGEPIQEVIFESRFADLLIVDPHMNFYDGEEQIPSHFTKEILANAECPVLLAPDDLEEINQVAFCYDGSASAAFAIKQFTYLMPSYKNKKALLLQVSGSGKGELDEDHRRLMAWMRAHYAIVTFEALKGQAKDELLTHFFMHTGVMVVMGSYGRSLLSNFFKHSAAEGLIRTVDLPIFITHH